MRRRHTSQRAREAVATRAAAAREHLEARHAGRCLPLLMFCFSNCVSVLPFRPSASSDPP